MIGCPLFWECLQPCDFTNNWLDFLFFGGDKFVEKVRRPFKWSSHFLIWYASHDWRGFGNLMFFSLWFALLGGSFVYLDVGPSTLFLVFTLFWVLWFIFDWKGFISTRLSSKATSIGNGFCLQICEVCGLAIIHRRT